MWVPTSFITLLFIQSELQLSYKGSKFLVSLECCLLHLYSPSDSYVKMLFFLSYQLYHTSCGGLKEAWSQLSLGERQLTHWPGCQYFTAEFISNLQKFNSFWASSSPDWNISIGLSNNWTFMKFCTDLWSPSNKGLWRFLQHHYELDICGLSEISQNVLGRLWLSTFFCVLWSLAVSPGFNPLVLMKGALSAFCTLWQLCVCPFPVST